MARAKPVSRIVWAIDAFDAGETQLERPVRFLRSFLSRSPAEVLPAYVLQASSLNLSIDLTPDWSAQYLPSAEHALDAAVEKLALPGLKPAKVLPETATTDRGAVRTLIRYAQSVGAQLIVASTHSRHGLERFILGSFAETLVVHSPLPVLVVGPQADIEPTADHILFPSDLGEHSRAFFEEAVGMARLLGMKMTLFHSVPHPVEAVVQHGMYLLGGAGAPIGAQLATDVDERRKKVEAFVSWAAARGVTVEPILHDQDANENIRVAVSEIVRDPKYALIAIGSQSGPMTAALMGSVSRELVRHSPKPVWILHLRKRQRREAA
jgi:nucleotide-binding universal stress UspA family protein